MELSEALDIVVGQTGHTRYRALCDPAHPDYEPAYESIVLRLAAGDVPPPMPSLFERGVNFARAVVSHVGAGMPTADDETSASRLAICRTCDQLTGDQCRKCGCNVPLKVAWAEQVCPLGKW